MPEYITIPTWWLLAAFIGSAIILLIVSAWALYIMWNDDTRFTALKMALAMAQPPKSQDNEPPFRHSLSDEDFKCLVNGRTLQVNGVLFGLQDIGYPRMHQIINGATTWPEPTYGD